MAGTGFLYMWNLTCFCTSCTSHVAPHLLASLMACRCSSHWANIKWVGKGRRSLFISVGCGKDRLEFTVPLVKMMHRETIMAMIFCAAPDSYILYHIRLREVIKYIIVWGCAQNYRTAKQLSDGLHKPSSCFSKSKISTRRVHSHYCDHAASSDALGLQIHAAAGQNHYPQPRALL
jgi:hypothetical protein